MQRQRREEDREAALEMQIARASGDEQAVRYLEEQARVLLRIRQLEDDGVSKQKARTQALAEDAPLREALAEAAGKEQKALAESARLEAMRILGLDGQVAISERQADLLRRTEAYRKAGLGVVAEIAQNGIDILVTDQADARARKDILAIDEARLRVQERLVREAEAEHRLNLARLSGDDGEAAWRDIEARINRRAREIERRGKDGKPLDYGEGVDQAQFEIQQELDAEALGARRSWLRGVLSDIKRGGIGDAVAEQLDRASSRWLDKLADSLSELNWGAMLKSWGGGGGWSDAFASLFSSGHSAGTDFSEGGFKWVRERGPELLNLPRGSKVVEHNRAMQMTAAAASPVVNLGGLTIKNYGSEPVQGRMTQTAGGGLELELEPMFKGMMARSGRDGSLAKALGSSPQPRRR